MGRDRRRNRDGIDPRVVQHRAQITGDFDGRGAGLHASKAIRPHIAHGHEPHTGQFPEIPDEVWTPIPVTDHCDANHALLLLIELIEVSTAASFTRPITFAGTPATTAYAGTSRVTTAPAPTSAPSPIVIPAK